MSFPTALHLLFETESLTEPGTHIFSFTDKPASLWIPMVSASPAATLEAFIAMSGLVKDGLRGL